MELARGKYVKTESTAQGGNFLGSEIGLLCKTMQVPASLGEVQGTRKVVEAGTVLPKNDATARGVLFEAVDVTDGDAIGSAVTAGHLLGKQLPVAPTAEAMEALGKRGLYFDDNEGGAVV